MRILLAAAVGAVVFSLTSCTSVQEIDFVMGKVNEKWKQENAEINSVLGAKVYPDNQEACFTAVEKTITNIGFRITEKDAEAGFIRGVAAAPIPLTEAEWEKVEEAEEPPYAGVSS